MYRRPKEFSMFRNTFRNGSALLALVAGLSLANAAQAQTVPYKEHSVGQVLSTVGNRQDWVAAGQGTHIGNYTEVGHHFFNADGTLYGVFTHTAADGSTISGAYAGTFEVIGDTGFARFDVDVVWLGGTGRLEGVTGIGIGSAILDLATQTFVVSASGLWDIP
jgi:hypothetical protein